MVSQAVAGKTARAEAQRLREDLTNIKSELIMAEQQLKSEQVTGSSPVLSVSLRNTVSFCFALLPSVHEPVTGAGSVVPSLQIYPALVLCLAWPSRCRVCF